MMLSGQNVAGAAPAEYYANAATYREYVTPRTNAAQSLRGESGLTRLYQTVYQRI